MIIQDYNVTGRGQFTAGRHDDNYDDGMYNARPASHGLSSHVYLHNVRLFLPFFMPYTKSGHPSYYTLTVLLPASAAFHHQQVQLLGRVGIGNDGAGHLEISLQRDSAIEIS